MDEKKLTSESIWKAVEAIRSGKIKLKDKTTELESCSLTRKEPFQHSRPNTETDNTHEAKMDAEVNSLNPNEPDDSVDTIARQGDLFIPRSSSGKSADQILDDIFDQNHGSDSLDAVADDEWDSDSAIVDHSYLDAWLRSYITLGRALTSSQREKLRDQLKADLMRTSTKKK
ncbi:MAG: hypothetical protein HWE12_12935 [Oceanospirillaceae bacterium]|nr:hypothetical protein [Oceanospirillaceae bacterium]